MTTQELITNHPLPDVALRATNAVRTYLAALVSDGLNEKTFLYTNAQATEDEAFRWAAEKNAARDMWEAAAVKEGHPFYYAGMRYAVTFYRAYWNGVPVIEAPIG